MVIFELPLVSAVPFFTKPGYESTLIFTTLEDPSIIILLLSRMKYWVKMFNDKSVAKVTLSVELGESVFVSVIGHIDEDTSVQGPLTLLEY